MVPALCSVVVDEPEAAGSWETRELPPEDYGDRRDMAAPGAERASIVSFHIKIVFRCYTEMFLA